jgi:hypothetical protein
MRAGLKTGGGLRQDGRRWVAGSISIVMETPCIVAPVQMRALYACSKS